MQIRSIWLLLLAVAIQGATARAQERADWWFADKQALEMLQTRDAGELARELYVSPLPTAPGELMWRFSVFNRAGHLRQTRQVIDAMSDANLETSHLSAMADFLIGRKDWRTARYFLERLPQAQPGWGYVLIKEWATTGDPKQIDAWLVERAEENPRYWLQERLRFRSDQGTAGELIEEFANRVRRQPHHVEVALQFLEVTSVARKSAEDIAWLGDICRPPSAYASYRLGTALRAAPRAAIALLEHSLKMPFTPEDVATLKAEMSHRALASPASPPFEHELRYSTKQELMTALHRAGESARAQKLLEELAAMQPAGLPPVGLDRLAGQIQAASGARVVQKNFEEAESENKQSADYWLKRASYFSGRKERTEAIAAYEKALQLSELDPDKNHGANANDPQAYARFNVVSSYVIFLDQSNLEELAARILERELRNMPLDGEHAERIVGLVLRTSGSRPFEIDRELLWAFLTARPRWSHQEEHLLRRLAQPPYGQPAKAWLRAEELARDRDPSRSLVLGWLMTRSNASAQAIPLLKSACQRFETPEEQQRAAFTLFGAYLDVGDWRSAEEAWGSARQRLTPHEYPDWLGRIATAAARAGATAEALRLWKQRTNFDRIRTDNLDEMLAAGLREPLLAFYRSLAESDPECKSIDPVIQHITSRN